MKAVSRNRPTVAGTCPLTPIPGRLQVSLWGFKGRQPTRRATKIPPLPKGEGTLIVSAIADVAA
ncbi:MAG: hypothetical protein FWE95_05455, partial [Planctomycetaceae bacterium]|nr:hypothetical protein [Planctomycetaceae bacterium]